MQVYIGCSGFHNKDWKEVFYPKGLPQRKWFEYYCSQFNTLELNTTFYRFPRVEFLQKWYDQSPEGFRFSVKVPRLISHYKQLKDCERLLNDFYAAVNEGLKEKLGPVLFQLPSRIKYSDIFLQRILENINRTCINVFEFRDISWWNETVFAQLSKNNITFCGINIENLPDDIVANTHTIYYRFHGIEKLYFSEYPIKVIKSFVEKLNTLSTDKVGSYIYFNNTATIAAANNAKQLQKLMLQLSKSGKTAF
ncbi:MAG: DUF72 domain-containing protein [Parafilimonas sp.]|nr:DUF72 domain-containing protein [Parafilimonas sp.]